VRIILQRAIDNNPTLPAYMAAHLRGYSNFILLMVPGSQPGLSFLLLFLLPSSGMMVVKLLVESISIQTLSGFYTNISLLLTFFLPQGKRKKLIKT
jgi:hypothetical protein